MKGLYSSSSSIEFGFSFAVCSNSMPRLPRGEATYTALPSFGTFLISQAYESISDGLGKSASALVRTPLKRYQRGDGAGSAFVSAIQSAPVAAIAPASAAARALHCALLGVRNRLGPASICVCSRCIFSESCELT